MSITLPHLQINTQSNKTAALRQEEGGQSAIERNVLKGNQAILL